MTNLTWARSTPAGSRLPGGVENSSNFSKKKPGARILTAAQRLQIAILMTPSICPMIFNFEPANLVYGKICMIRQKRAFVMNEQKCSGPPDDDVLSITPAAPLVTELPVEHHDPLNPHHILVHEIAFGHNLEECIPPCALWFNIPEDAITECSLSDQLKQNRTMKKIRQRQRKCGGTTTSSTSTTNSSSSSRVDRTFAASPLRNGGDTRTTNTNNQGAEYLSNGTRTVVDEHQDAIYAHYAAHRAFQMYNFHDASMHRFMKEVMILELDKIRHERQGEQECKNNFSYSSMMAPRNANQQIQDEVFVRKFVLQNQLESLKTFLLDSGWWPVNLGREYISDKTPVPMAETIYIVPPTRKGGELLDQRNHSNIEQYWNSFLNNIQYIDSQHPSDLSAQQGNLDMMIQKYVEEHDHADHASAANKQKGIPYSMLGPFEDYHISSEHAHNVHIRDVESTPHAKGTMVVMNHLPIFEYILYKSEALEWAPDCKER